MWCWWNLGPVADEAAWKAEYARLVATWSVDPTAAPLRAGDSLVTEFCRDDLASADAPDGDRRRVGREPEEAAGEPEAAAGAAVHPADVLPGLRPRERQGRRRAVVPVPAPPPGRVRDQGAVRRGRGDGRPRPVFPGDGRALRRAKFQEGGRDRALFSTPVRRLQDKAQVFPLEPHDSVRTRLTHSLEVSNVARGLAQAIAAELRKREEITPRQAEAIEQIAAAKLVPRDRFREWAAAGRPLAESRLTAPGVTAAVRAAAVRPLVGGP